MKIKIFAAGIIIFLGLLGKIPPIYSADDPQMVFQKWLAAARQGNMEEVLNLSSAQSRKKAEDQMKAGTSREQMVQMLKFMSPENVKILKQTASADQKKVSLFVEGMMQDLFNLEGKKPKKALEKGEIRLVSENGVWKLDKQCWGSDGRCEKEDKGVKISFGKKVPLKQGASLVVEKGKGGDFASVKTKENPFAVNVVLQGSSENPMVNYALHASPDFADFYLKVGDQKITPTAFIEDTEKKEVKILEPHTTYSRSKTIGDKTVISILFDVPRDLKGPKTFWAKFNVADQDFWFQIAD